MDDQPKERMLSTTEYAKLRGLEPATVTRWCRTGYLPRRQGDQPGVERIEAGGVVVYLIPESLLDHPIPPTGRPKKK